MTAIAVVSITLAFVSGIRGSFFVVMALVAVAIAAVEVAEGHYWLAIFYSLAMQIAYMTGLLINAMRR